MNKRILLFEPDGLLRKTLLEQILLNKEFHASEARSFDEIKCQLAKSSFDLVIISTDREACGLCSIEQAIKEAEITSIVLFMIEPKISETSPFGNSAQKYYFIERPFRIHSLNKKISTILAKISNSNEVTHKVGPFIFLPLTKALMLGEKTKVELTEKEVAILKCLIGAGEEAVDRDTLLKQVWNYSPDVTTHTLETHIYRLRQKLEIDASIPRLIISKDGGFTINSP
jgi:DNA-binding response OmpR family regulator